MLHDTHVDAIVTFSLRMARWSCGIKTVNLCPLLDQGNVELTPAHLYLAPPKTLPSVSYITGLIRIADLSFQLVLALR